MDVAQILRSCPLVVSFGGDEHLGRLLALEIAAEEELGKAERRVEACKQELAQVQQAKMKAKGEKRRVTNALRDHKTKKKKMTNGEVAAAMAALAAAEDALRVSEREERRKAIAVEASKEWVKRATETCDEKTAAVVSCVQSQFRRRSVLWHPDKGGNRSRYEEMKAAADALKSAKFRYEYFQSLRTVLQAGAVGKRLSWSVEEMHRKLMDKLDRNREAYDDSDGDETAARERLHQKRREGRGGYSAGNHFRKGGGGPLLLESELLHRQPATPRVDADSESTDRREFPVLVSFVVPTDGLLGCVDEVEIESVASSFGEPLYKGPIEGASNAIRVDVKEAGSHEIRYRLWLRENGVVGASPWSRTATIEVVDPIEEQELEEAEEMRTKLELNAEAVDKILSELSDDNRLPVDRAVAARAAAAKIGELRGKRNSLHHALTVKAAGLLDRARREQVEEEEEEEEALSESRARRERRRILVDVFSGASRTLERADTALKVASEVRDRRRAKDHDRMLRGSTLKNLKLRLATNARTGLADAAEAFASFARDVFLVAEDDHASTTSSSSSNGAINNQHNNRARTNAKATCNEAFQWLVKAKRADVGAQPRDWANALREAAKRTDCFSAANRADLASRAAFFDRLEEEEHQKNERNAERLERVAMTNADLESKKAAVYFKIFAYQGSPLAVRSNNNGHPVAKEDDSGDDDDHHRANNNDDNVRGRAQPDDDDEQQQQQQRGQRKQAVVYCSDSYNTSSDDAEPDDDDDDDEREDRKHSVYSFCSDNNTTSRNSDDADAAPRGLLAREIDQPNQQQQQQQRVFVERELGYDHEDRETEAEEQQRAVAESVLPKDDDDLLTEAPPGMRRSVVPPLFASFAEQPGKSGMPARLMGMRHPPRPQSDDSPRRRGYLEPPGLAPPPSRGVGLRAEDNVREAQTQNPPEAAGFVGLAVGGGGGGGGGEISSHSQLHFFENGTRPPPDFDASVGGHGKPIDPPLSNAFALSMAVPIAYAEVIGFDDVQAPAPHSHAAPLQSNSSPPGLRPRPVAEPGAVATRAPVGLQPAADAPVAAAPPPISRQPHPQSAAAPAIVAPAPISSMIAEPATRPQYQQQQQQIAAPDPMRARTSRQQAAAPSPTQSMAAAAAATLYATPPRQQNGATPPGLNTSPTKSPSRGVMRKDDAFSTTAPNIPASKLRDSPGVHRNGAAPPGSHKGGASRTSDKKDASSILASPSTPPRHQLRINSADPAPEIPPNTKGSRKRDAPTPPLHGSGGTRGGKESRGEEPASKKTATPPDMEKRKKKVNQQQSTLANDDAAKQVPDRKEKNTPTARAPAELPQPPGTLSTRDMLVELGLESLVAIFQEEEILDVDTCRCLQDSDLSAIGVKLGPRAKIRHWLASPWRLPVDQVDQQSIRQARRAVVTPSTTSSESTHAPANEASPQLSEDVSNPGWFKRVCLKCGRKRHRGQCKVATPGTREWKRAFAARKSKEESEQATN